MVIYGLYLLLASGMNKKNDEVLDIWKFPDMSGSPALSCGGAELISGSGSPKFSVRTLVFAINVYF